MDNFKRTIIKEYRKQIEISLGKGNNTQAKQFQQRIDILLKN